MDISNKEHKDNQWPRPIKELAKILGSTKERIHNIKKELGTFFVHDVLAFNNYYLNEN